MLLIAVLAMAAVVTASPVEPRAKSAVLPLKHVSHVTSIKNIVSKGQARIRKANGAHAVGVIAASSGPVTNEDVSYVAAVSIGGSSWDLIVDTGCELNLLDARKEKNPLT